MHTIDIAVEPGDVFEFWLKALAPGPGIGFLAGERVCWAVTSAAPHFVHHLYETMERGTLRLEWDPAITEVSLGYHFRPATVYDEGLTFIRFEPDGLSLHGQPAMGAWYRRESGRPVAHFSPFQGWMNDPNGSCRFGENYHLFYQFNPNDTVSGPMNWGHAVSRDLVSWRHLPVFRQPSQNLYALSAGGGAFSGSAFVEGDTLSFYMTERTPTYGATGVFHEIQQLVEPDARVLRTKSVTTVLDRRPEIASQDFRDPKVFRVANGGFRMILGSAVDGDPAVLLFSSPDALEWEFHSVLYRAPALFSAHGAGAAECPDFFPVGDRCVLITGFIGYTDPESGRRHPTYGLVGRFENDVFTPEGEPQELDFGTDFYAFQTFADGDRHLGWAWAFNWSTKKPPGSVYSGELTLPREVRLDGEGAICLPIVPEAQGLRGEQLDFNAIPAGTAFVLELGGLSGLDVELRGPDGALRVYEQDGWMAIVTPGDDGIVFRSRPAAFRDVTIHFDHGLLEVTANGGAINGTRRSYTVFDVAQISVRGAAEAKGWALKPIW